MRIVLLTLLCTAFLSCSERLVDEPADGSYRPEFIGRPLGRVQFPGAEYYQGTSPSARAARVELLSAVMERYKQVRNSVQRLSMGEVGQGELMAALDAAGLSEAERWFFEQMSAMYVLESMVGVPGVAGRLGEGEIEWEPHIARQCVQRLVAHRNPNAPLLARALSRLKRSWSSEDIARTASAASVHAAQWLGTQCGGCPERSLPPARANATFSIQVARVQQGIEDLRRIAAGG